MSSDLQTQLTEAEKSFKRACEQIIHLNRRLDEMAKRYDKASRENHRSFRYSLRLRMAVSEGVRNMYYEYAANKADLISDLRYKVADSTGLRTVADGVGLRTERNVNPVVANRVEGEQREWESTRESTRNGVDGNTNRKTKKPKRSARKTRATSTQESPSTSAGTSTSASASATSSMENDEDEPAVPLTGAMPVSQYDSSDIDSPGTSGSGVSVVSERLEGPELVEQYFTSNSVDNSESVRTASNSPDSYTSSP